MINANLLGLLLAICSNPVLWLQAAISLNTIPIWINPQMLGDRPGLQLLLVS
ncbi:MAG: hypothetical protein VKJ64_07005 [Leptolyngbyaceae bacterium]|nr:hypothetical protein [Leptolyngbyaceae bacterium]